VETHPIQKIIVHSNEPQQLTESNPIDVEYEDVC